MDIYILELENKDSLSSVREKLSTIDAGRIVLVWPKRGSVIKHPVELTLLQRHVRKIGKQVALAGVGEQTAHDALRVGIPVFRNSNDASRSAWRRQPLMKTPQRRDNNRFQNLSGGRNRQVAAARDFNKQHLLRYGFFFISLISTILLFLILALPQATVRLNLQTEEQNTIIPVWSHLSTGKTAPGGGIPATPLRVTVKGEGMIPTTGEAMIPESWAEGSVAFTSLVESPVEIPAGTIVLTSSNPANRFSTVEAARIPAGLGQTKSVKAIAVTGGSAGNVSAGEIDSVEGMIGLAAMVTNLEPLTGGASRSVPAPTIADHERLYAEVLTNLQDKARENFLESMDPEMVILPASTRLSRVIQERRQPEAGDPGDTLVLFLEAEFETWAVRSPELANIAQATLDAALPRGYRPDNDRLTIEVMDNPRADVQTLYWEFKASRLITKHWKEEWMLMGISGKSKQAAESLLESELSLEGPVQISILPAWWGKLPLIPFRIRIETV